MDRLAELDAAFHQLLLDPEARAKLASDPETLGWSSRVTTLLRAAKPEDFHRLGRAIVKGVGSGTLCGFNLRSAFLATITLLAPLTADQVLERFVASAQFRRIRAVGNVAGYSSAQGFYDWIRATSAAPGVLAAAQRDYVRATLVTLASVPEAYFRTEDPLIRTVEGGWVAVLDSTCYLLDPEAVPECPLALGAVRQRFWIVPLSRSFAAALLRASTTPPAWAIEQLTGGELEFRLSAMRARGML